jgi:acetolactate synthase-1/2/3 large subunit
MDLQRGSKALLTMLREYEVKHVFGLCGETTLDLYRDWYDFPHVAHIAARDERSAAFMADAYSRMTSKPGVCEAPSVGSTHVIPGVAEAYKASVPMLVMTSDVPLHTERRNMLTGIDQTALFKGITKETITVYKGSEIPFTIRRAFRLATTGKPGPVHIRIPSNVFDEEVEEKEIYAQKDFARYPGHRPVAGIERIGEAIELLAASERPVLVCGQGVLFSGAWNEVTELAELFGIVVGTTTTGKGSIAETHPLSIGVVGARGGTGFSNKSVEESDVLFFVGCNTDSALTDSWELPPLDTDKKIIHLDISEAEIGNNYRSNVVLLGDAKATLRMMIKMATEKVRKRKYDEIPRIQRIVREAEEYRVKIEELMDSDEKPVHPMRFVKEFSKTIPEDHVIVADPGVSAIYPAAFYKVKQAGRSILFNYSLGALGYAVPASVGAHYARPNSCVVALTGDGSYGFTVGELETISRVGGNIKVILFNNGSYGWIRASVRFSSGSTNYFATQFNSVDYVKIAEGFGLEAYTVEEPDELETRLKKVFRSRDPTFLEIKVKPEDELAPPVPSWAKMAIELGVEYVY